MIVALVAGREAPSELRDRIALDEPAARSVLKSSECFEELAVLSTCHRTELYAVSSAPMDETTQRLACMLPGLRADDLCEMRLLQDMDAVEHLLRVACGLDALVIGEPHVVAQVRKAFVMAQEEGRIAASLSMLFARALRLGKMVRTSTPLGHLGLSIGSIVVNELESRFGSLANRRAVIVGTGEAAKDAALRIAQRGAHLSIVGRSPQSAAKLAHKVNGDPYQLDDLHEVLSRSELGVVAVSGGELITERFLAGTGALTLIDLSVPGAVAPSSRSDVVVIRLKDLSSPSDEKIASAVESAESIIEQELVSLEKRFHAEVSREIHELRARAEIVALDEAARTSRLLGLQSEQAERLATMATRLAHKLLHAPTAALNNGDTLTRETLARVFDLNASSRDST
ncbi:MAG: glutamyl-tRNA reductase [Actinomycetota bacterium]